jgi:hypothetical protein
MTEKNESMVNGSALTVYSSFSAIMGVMPSKTDSLALDPAAPPRHADEGRHPRLFLPKQRRGWWPFGHHDGTGRDAPESMITPTGVIRPSPPDATVLHAQALVASR